MRKLKQNLKPFVIRSEELYVSKEVKEKCSCIRKQIINHADQKQ